MGCGAVSGAGSGCGAVSGAGSGCGAVSGAGLGCGAVSGAGCCSGAGSDVGCDVGLDVGVSIVGTGVLAPTETGTCALSCSAPPQADKAVIPSMQVSSLIFIFFDDIR